MPCYDSRDAPENVRADALREFTHNSPVAEMLCDVMKVIEHQHSETLRSDIMEQLPPSVLKWWDEHKRRDAAKPTG